MQPAQMIERLHREHPDAAAAAEETLRQVLVRSTTDWDFRQHLLAQPRAAVAEHLQVPESQFPEWMKLRFVENTADMTVVLPDAVADAAELDERQLESVAGGTFTLLAIAAVTLEVYDWSVDDGHCTKKTT